MHLHWKKTSISYDVYVFRKCHMKGIRLLHLKHANEENPKSIEAVIEMEASSMLHKVYLANLVSPCLTRKGCWFSMLESLQNGQSTNHPVFRCVGRNYSKGEQLQSL
jgi:hypothetical protein